MSASASSDSWILIALTILVVLLLFYLSKKMICNSYYGGEEGPTSQSSSSSSSSPYAYASASNSESTSSSDYYCGGSSPFDPGELSSAPSSSTDDFHNVDRIHRENPLDVGTGSWRTMTENGCGYNNNNNEDNINNFGLRRDIVTSLDIGREEGSATLPSSSSAASPPRFYREMRPPAISIISSEDMDRKTMLEGQLRNQITRIVQAEREIQRLVQLLATEQGMDSRQYLRVAARASHRPEMRHLYSTQDHGGIIPTSSNSSRIFERSTTSSEARAAEATVQLEPSTLASTSRKVSMLPFKHSNDMMPSLSHSVEIFPATTPPHSPILLNDDDEGDEDGDDDRGPPPSHLHQNDASGEGTQLEQNERLVPSLSNFLLAPQNTDQQVCTPSPSSLSGIDPRSLFRGEYGHHHHHNHCRCNLCCTMSMSTSSGRIRRMLLLRQMLLPISSSYQVESEARCTGGTRDRLSTTLTSCLHYPVEDEQPVHSRPAYLQRSPIPEDDHRADNDDLPTYEECIRSSSTYNNNSIYQLLDESNLPFINNPMKLSK